LGWDVNVGPAVYAVTVDASGTAYAAGPATLFAVDAASGAAVWAVQTPSAPTCVPAISIGTGLLFWCGSSGHVVAYSIADGSVAWDYELEAGVVPGGGLTVYVSLAAGNITHCYGVFS
jgi:outer membrane protein assembly factor BamB